MNFKRLVGCLVALLIACAFVRFGAHPAMPMGGPGSDIGERTTVGATSRASTIELVVNPTARMPVLPETGQPVEAVRFLTDLMALLASGPSEEHSALLAQLVAAQPTAVLEDLIEDEKAGLALPAEVWQTMLRCLARDDAPWTGDYLTTMPQSPLRAELLGTLLAQWGADDLPAAIKWAQQLDDASLQQPALIHLSYRWFESDSVGALTFAALHPAEHQQLLTALVGQWSREQPEAVVAWAAEFSNEPVMAHVAAGAVAAWAKHDPLAAGEFVLKLPDGNLRQEAAISVMSALAQEDPKTGAQWVTVFPAGPERDYAIENLVYRWATADADSALFWANRLTSSERDTALFAGAGGLVEAKPLQAISWAMSINDESRRTKQAERAAQRWLEIDRWAAEAWIRQSILPPETKTRLLASRESGS